VRCRASRATGSLLEVPAVTSYHARRHSFELGEADPQPLAVLRARGTPMHETTTRPAFAEENEAATALSVLAHRLHELCGAPAVCDVAKRLGLPSSNAAMRGGVNTPGETLVVDNQLRSIPASAIGLYSARTARPEGTA